MFWNTFCDQQLFYKIHHEYTRFHSFGKTRYRDLPSGKWIANTLTTERGSTFAKTNSIDSVLSGVESALHFDCRKRQYLRENQFYWFSFVRSLSLGAQHFDPEGLLASGKLILLIQFCHFCAFVWNVYKILKLTLSRTLRETPQTCQNWHFMFQISVAKLQK